MMVKLEISSLCRLCLQVFDSDKLFPIFNNETSNNQISLSKRIFYCSSIKVTENDGLPPRICNDCLLKLKDCFVFRNQCTFANILLEQLKKYSFNVNELPQISDVDFENQIINIENEDCIHQLYLSLCQAKIETNSEETSNEFFNSKIDRTKKEIISDVSFSTEKNLEEDINHDSFHGLVCDLEDNLLNISEGFSNSFVNIKKEDLSLQSDLNDEMKNENSEPQSESITLVEKDLKTDSNIINELDYYPKNLFKSVLKPKIRTCKKSKSKPVLHQKRKKSVCKEKPATFKCEYCNKVYPSEGGWRYHKYTIHNDNYQPFICDLCGQSFKVKKNLEAHKNSIHFHLKHHICDLCGRGFASKYSLKVHKSWHNDEKNFGCDICGTKFRTRGKLNSHKSIHGGPKNFMCHICSKDFRWKKDFEIHVRTHTGEKPFKCSHCGKAFAALTNMKKHERNHIKKNVVEGSLEVVNDKLEKFEGSGSSFFGFRSEGETNEKTNVIAETALYVICK